MRAQNSTPMLKSHFKGTIGPAIKHWLWSHRAIFVGAPLLISSAAPLNLTEPLLPSNTIIVDPLATVTVTTPPVPALDLVTTVSPQQRLRQPVHPTTEPDRPVPGVSPPSPTDRPQTLPNIPVRIGIARWVPTLKLSTETSAVIMDASGQQVAELPAGSPVIIEPNADQLLMGNWEFPPQIWIKPKSEGYISVNGRWYRGTVQLILDRQRLVAVNHLDLESYLYGVVGSEMPASWPIEALKAQAVAARSYALARVSSNPASPFFDLGDTPRWQAYKGLETETNTTQLAVDSTQGLLISYEGAVVESLYASTSHLVRQVHRGYGMSQNGARKLAQQQFNYRQILNHYYPGTTLTWLEAS